MRHDPRRAPSLTDVTSEASAFLGRSGGVRPGGRRDETAQEAGDRPRQVLAADRVVSARSGPGSRLIDEHHDLGHLVGEEVLEDDGHPRGPADDHLGIAVADGPPEAPPRARPRS